MEGEKKNDCQQGEGKQNRNKKELRRTEPRWEGLVTKVYLVPVSRILINFQGSGRGIIHLYGMILTKWRVGWL